MLFKPELKTKFEVISVHFELYAESTWFLKHKNINLPVKLYDQLSETLPSDEKLSGKIIDVQIDIRSAELVKTFEKRKNITQQGNFSKVTGKIIKEFDSGDEFYSYFLDSVFPINVSFSGEKMNFSKEEWVTVEGEAYIILPRGCNIKKEIVK